MSELPFTCPSHTSGTRPSGMDDQSGLDADPHMLHLDNTFRNNSTAFASCMLASLPSSALPFQTDLVNSSLGGIASGDLSIQPDPCVFVSRDSARTHKPTCNFGGNPEMIFEGQELHPFEGYTSESCLVLSCLVLSCLVLLVGLTRHLHNLLSFFASSLGSRLYVVLRSGQGGPKPTPEGLKFRPQTRPRVASPKRRRLAPVEDLREDATFARP
ncbi:unnamed protein product [Protopolystoma xenopodis]|uniref:Uncharacterized protein n=1 Tax=Protopolystoma xenopodis TaxID=117903 RepID=A0A448WNG6_9PLAT|nr:unnamed protein product [Protopolystoma xenopodis]